MLKILTVPEEMEILRRKSEPILKFDEELAEFLRDLGETLKGQKDPAGVGLSAIQVGKPIRAFAMFLPQIGLRAKGQGPREKPILQFYVNPEMVEHAAQMTLGEELIENREQRTENSKQKTENKHQKPFLEGCLSIPRIYGAVLRWPWIRAKAAVFSETDLLSPLALSPHPLALTLDALASRVFQHELDHLNGILFTDHVLAQGNKLFREEGREMVEMEM